MPRPTSMLAAALAASLTTSLTASMVACGARPKPVVEGPTAASGDLAAAESDPEGLDTTHHGSADAQPANAQPPHVQNPDAQAPDWPPSGAATGDATGSTSTGVSDAGESSGSRCAGPPPGPGYVCVQNCGPPVARAGDPPPGHSWLSRDDADRRQRFGCPICLPADARVATPEGEVAISRLHRGDGIFTLGTDGRRIRARVLHASHTPVATGHRLIYVTLADGRRLRASPGHPAADHRPLGDLEVGDVIDGSTVTGTELLTFDGDATFDVLPGGPTGTYWVDGVLLESSFHSRD